MKIEIFLNPEHELAALIQTDLAAELDAIPASAKFEITKKIAPPPKDALALGEVVAFIIEHKDEIKDYTIIAKNLIDIIGAVMRRHKVSPVKSKSKTKSKTKATKPKTKTVKQKDNPVVVIKINNAILALPTTKTGKENFVSKIRHSI